MGDRGNIVVVQKNYDGSLPSEVIYLYTHWCGSEIDQILATALERRLRWDDPAYLTRIIFDQPTGLEGSETGYGISLSPTDNEHDYLVIVMSHKAADQRVFTLHGRGDVLTALRATPDLGVGYQEFIDTTRKAG